MTVFTPRCWSSIPQARPVGPAPTTRASKDSVICVLTVVAPAVLPPVPPTPAARPGALQVRLQLALYLAINGFQRSIQRRHVLTAALGHVGPAAALASHRLRERPYQFPSVDLAREILRHPRNE